jgi:hypothetical protein
MSIDKEVGVKSLLGYKLKKTQHALRLHMDEALSELLISLHHNMQYWLN